MIFIISNGIFPEKNVYKIEINSNIILQKLEK